MNSVVKTVWKKAGSVKADNNFRLHLIMEDGEKLDLDLTSLINRRQAFWRLKAFRYFKTVSIDPLGGLCWPEGEDISPTKMLDYKQ